MILKTTAIAAGLAAVLAIGTAIAQPAPQGSYQGGYQGNYQGPPPSYQGGSAGGYGYAGSYARPHHHGVIALIKQEASAGRISQKEATLLERKIHEMRREHRAERMAGYNGQQGGYGYQGGPPPSAYQGQPQQH